MKKKHTIYMASGWFSKHANMLEASMYGFLTSDDRLDVYSPRRDGTKLEPGQFHDHNLRAKVFDDNVVNIKDADLVIANIDSHDGHLDTGTVWEIGYAINNDIPLILYTGLGSDGGEDYEKSPHELFGFNLDAELVTVDSFSELKDKYEEVLGLDSDEKSEPMTMLVVGPTNDLRTIRSIKGLLSNKGIVAIGIDEFVSKSNRNKLARSFRMNPVSTIEDAMESVDGVVAVIDDRNPLVSMTMGIAYNMKKPMISYTNFDYGVNLMLMLSIARHVKGLGQLEEAIDVVNESGFDGLGDNDSEGVKVI